MPIKVSVFGFGVTISYMKFDPDRKTSAGEQVYLYYGVIDGGKKVDGPYSMRRSDSPRSAQIIDAWEKDGDVIFAQ